VVSLKSAAFKLEVTVIWALVSYDSVYQLQFKTTAFFGETTASSLWNWLNGSGFLCVWPFEGYILYCGVKSIICSKQLHRNKHIPLDINKMCKRCDCYLKTRTFSEYHETHLLEAYWILHRLTFKESKMHGSHKTWLVNLYEHFHYVDLVR
jgi:hypothetical protein